MSKQQAEIVLCHIRRLAAAGASGPEHDRQLLERFALRHDEAAFAALLHRHGAMVLRACRRILHDAHEAEDAFQATFLILARKAGAIRQHQALGGWLYRVAYRVAIRARAAAVRREELTVRVPQRVSVDPLAEVSGRELLGVLDDELQRLPEKYRAPLLLCYLEGHTQDEAARQLGWNPQTLRGRIERGRAVLRRRLQHRGFDLSAALTGTLLEQTHVPAAVPSALAARTLRAAASSSLHQNAIVSAHVTALAEGGLNALGAAKVKLVVSVVLMLGVLAAGLGTGLPLLRVPSPQTPSSPAATPTPSSPAAAPTAQAKDEPRRDRYGDPLPPSAIARLGSLRLHHGQHVYRVTLSPDGKRVVSSAQDGNRLWNAATGRELPLRQELRQAAIFATRDKLLAVAKHHFDLQLWDVVAGKKIGAPLPAAQAGQLPVAIHLGYPDGYSPIRLSPDGRTLVIANGTTLRFCDAIKGKVEEPIDLKLGNVSRTRMAFSADGKTLVVQFDNATVHVWDVSRRTEKSRSRPSPNDFGGQIALSPDGKILATAPFAGKRVRLWDVGTLKELPPLLKQPEEFMGAIAFSPDGKQLAVSPITGPTVYLWDLATRKQARQFQGRAYQIFHTVFSADGKYLAAGDGDGVALWDAATGQFRHDFGHTYPIDSICFSPDGKRLVSGAAYTDKIVRVWNPLTGTETAQLCGHTSGIEVVAYAPDGKLIASASQDGAVRLWDAATGREVRRLEAKDDMVYAMAFAPDGKTIASGGKRKAIHLWDVATGRELRSFDNPGKFILRLAFSPDGKMIATRGMDEKEIRLWDVTQGKQIRRLAGPKAGVPSLAFSRDGQTLAVGCDDGAVRLWDVLSGEERRTLIVPNAASGRVFSVAFSPDGRTLAAGYGEGSPMPHMVRLWELSTGRERFHFEGHQGGVASLSFSPDGTLLASGGIDHLIMVWDMTGQRTAKLPRKGRLRAAEGNALWSELADADAPKAYRAMQTLFAAGEQAVSMLRSHLRPAAAVDEKRIERLFADLDSEAYAVRQKAAKELREGGDAVESAAQKVLAGKPSVEQRLRVKQLLQEIEAVRSPDYLRGLRAVEVLEHIGTAEARKVLKTLADGAAAARLTREAKASLERLARNK